jgi:hypothetical protein
MTTAADLEQRLHTILTDPPQPRRRWPAGLVVVSLGCAALPFGLRFNFIDRPVPATIAATPLGPAEGCDPGVVPDRPPGKFTACCPS